MDKNKTMTKEDFLKCFNLLENEFGKQSEELKEIWYSLFNVYKVEDLEEAIKHWLKIIKKLPVPAYIIDDVEWIKKEKAEKAYWEALAISNKNDLNYKEGNE